MNLSSTIRTAAALAGTLLLLGLMPRQDAYRAYVGSWTCTRPAMGQGWWGSLTVTRTSHGGLQFVEQRQSPNAPAGGNFYIWREPNADVWKLSSPTYPFVETGARHNGVILFKDPAPRKRRFRLSISHDGREITMLAYLKNTQILNLTNFIVSCTKDSQ
jgi:hypothetical protein